MHLRRCRGVGRAALGGLEPVRARLHHEVLRPGRVEAGELHELVAGEVGQRIARGDAVRGELGRDLGVHALEGEQRLLDVLDALLALDRLGEERVARAAKTLRIEHLLDRKVDRLSGGEMQRVSIGRAIVRKPRVFLMDEPLSALDAKLRESLRTELKNLQMQLGATFLFVTHDQIEAMSMGDKVGVLNHGRIVQTGTPHEIYNNPRDTYVASFVGSPPMNLIDGRLVNGRAVMAPLNFELPFSGGAKASGATDGRPLVFGVRPEDVYLESGAPVEARVHDVENHGVEKILTLRVGDATLRATVPARTDVAIEQAVRFAWNPDKVVLFDKGSGVSLRHAG